MILFIFGLIFGSFITALSFRYPRNISNVYGRSFCDNCKHELSWFENIPLFSYILLKGKCKNCKNVISIRYPLIELATGLAFYVIGFNILNLILFILLFTIVVIDIEHQIIPDSFTFILILMILLFSKNIGFENLFSGFLASLFLLLIHIFTKGKGMGLGDVKFAIFGGIFVGLAFLPVWFFIAFLTGGFVGTILILSKKAKFKDKIAFGPFLVLAIPVTLIWGEKLIKLLL